MPIKNFLSRKLTYLFSWEGAAFLFMIYMLYTKIYGDARYMGLTFAMCLCILQVYKKNYWDGVATKIVLFSVLYSLLGLFHYPDVSRFWLFYFAISPVFFYLFGKIVVVKVKSDNDLIFFWWLAALALGIVIYQTIGYSGTIVSVDDTGERSFHLTKNSDGISATAIGTFVSLGLVGLGASLYSVKGLIKRSLWMILFLLSISTVVYLINRTGLYVSVAVVLSMAWLKGGGNLSRVLPYLLIAIVFVVIVINSGLVEGTVFQMYEIRSEQDTFGDRVERWGKGFIYLFQYPLGWGHLKSTFDGYMHNLWLDIARRGGIVCFLLFVSVTYASLRQLLQLLKRKRTSFIIFGSGLYICFFLSSMIEPIIDVLPQYMMLFLLLCGMLKQYKIKQYPNDIRK